VFAEAQWLYASHGISVFPVTENKKPAVRGYLNVGLNYSRELADRFPEHQAFGFATNSRNGITILDVDTTDENVLADALNRHGRTPLIARTASGKYHAYYKHSGEKRRIRPWPGRDIDLLGTGGMAVAVPSVVGAGEYEFIEGCLHLIPELPVLQNLDLSPAHDSSTGTRNRDLFRHCMKQARHCDSLEALLDVAETFNGELVEPLDSQEVSKVAASAWHYEETGTNYVGVHGAFFATNEAVDLITTDQDAFVMVAFLRASNRPDDVFMVANGLAERLGWTPKRVAAARTRLIDSGYIKRVRGAYMDRKTGIGRAALYVWEPVRDKLRLREKGVS
jgi:hypothetical protein